MPQPHANRRPDTGPGPGTRPSPCPLGCPACPHLISVLHGSREAVAPIVWADLVVVLCSVAQGYCPPSAQAGRTALAHIPSVSPILRSYGGNLPRQGGLPVPPALPQLRPRPTPRTLEARGWAEAHSSSDPPRSWRAGGFSPGPLCSVELPGAAVAVEDPPCLRKSFFPWEASGTPGLHWGHSAEDLTPLPPCSQPGGTGEQMWGGSDVKLPCYQEGGHGHGEVS